MSTFHVHVQTYRGLWGNASSAYLHNICKSVPQSLSTNDLEHVGSRNTKPWKQGPAPLLVIMQVCGKTAAALLQRRPPEKYQVDCYGSDGTCNWSIKCPSVYSQWRYTCKQSLIVSSQQICGNTLMNHGYGHGSMSFQSCLEKLTSWVLDSHTQGSECWGRLPIT